MGGGPGCTNMGITAVPVLPFLVGRCVLGMMYCSLNMSFRFSMMAEFMPSSDTEDESRSYLAEYEDSG